MNYRIPTLLVLALAIQSMCAGPGNSKTLPKPKVVYARQLTVENGLSSNFVYTILRDSRNFTWIGTINGLNKFDGQSFRHYFRKPFDSSGLQSNIINALAEDRSGAIWVGTLDAGLEKLDRNTDTFTHYIFNPSDPSSIGSDDVECLFVDSKGRIWIGLGNGELDYFEPRTQKFWRYTNVASLNFSLSINHILSITEDANGILLIRKSEGAIFFDPATAACKPFTVLGMPGGKNSERLYFYKAPDHPSGFLQETEHSFYYFDSLSTRLQIHDGKKVITPRMRFPVNCLLYRNDSVFWNFSPFGFFEINISSLTVSAIEIRSLTNIEIKLLNPRSTAATKDGSIWIATENGIIIVEPKLQPIAIYPLPVEKKSEYASARSLCLDKQDRLWVGTSTGTLYHLDSSSAILREFPIDNYKGASALNRMSVDGDMLWVAGSGSPLLEINLKKHIFTNFRGKITFPSVTGSHSLLIDGPSLWIGLEEPEHFIGKAVLNLMTLSAFSSHQYEYLPNESGLTVRRIITTIVKRDAHSLWLGSVHGLFIFDISNGEFTRYAHDRKDPRSISGDYVWVVHPDRRGQLWVGTWSDGLNLFDEKKKTFRHYTTEDGLPSNSIRAIVEDRNGDLWISTENGISHFDQREKTFTNFGIPDGLLDRVYEPNSAAIASDGKLFFGGSHGISSFYPDNVKLNVTAAPLYITSFRIGNTLRLAEIASGSEIALDHNENDLSFEFAELDYRDPSHKHYEYKLDGGDESWINSGTFNIARYNNIEPGVYLFKFRVKEDTSFVYSSMFTITPAFWMTWWFKFGILLVCVLIAAFIYKRRIAFLKNHQVQLELATENERVNIAGELHDGPLQDLYAAHFLLGSPAQNMEMSAVEGQVKKVVKELLAVMSELQMPRFELGLAEEIRNAAEVFGEHYPSVTMTTQISDLAPEPPKNVQQNLFRIFRTCLANIAKHADADEVRISLVTNGDTLMLLIADNGKGFEVFPNLEEYARKNHYGLLLAENYALSIGATLEIISAPLGGTTISVLYHSPMGFWHSLLKGRSFAYFKNSHG